MKSSIVFAELTHLEVFLRLMLAALLGGVIGFEREWRERAAGLRTHILVSVGAAAMTIVSAYGWADFFTEAQVPQGSPAPLRDPARLAAQIVSGIGFLGGGVILRSGTNVKGLTTAASIWAVSGVGIAVGAGMYVLGAMATAILLFSLTLLKKINDAVYHRYHHDNARLIARIGSEDVLDTLMDKVKETSAKIDSFSLEPAGLDTQDQVVTVTVTLNQGVSTVDFARLIAPVKGVNEVHVREMG